MDRLKHAVGWLVVGLIVAQLPAFGQDRPQGRTLTPAELEQIVAPIALYPDAVLAQMMMAATFPLQIVQAARFTRAHAELQGDALSAALEGESWDESVKSLVVLPQVLQTMGEWLDWTQKLGDAFLAQPQDLSEAVQQLRSRAQAKGDPESDRP